MVGEGGYNIIVQLQLNFLCSELDLLPVGHQRLKHSSTDYDNDSPSGMQCPSIIS